MQFLSEKKGHARVSTYDWNSIEEQEKEHSPPTNTVTQARLKLYATRTCMCCRTIWKKVGVRYDVPLMFTAPNKPGSLCVRSYPERRMKGCCDRKCVNRYVDCQVNPTWARRSGMETKEWGSIPALFVSPCLATLQSTVTDADARQVSLLQFYLQEKKNGCVGR